MSKSLLLLKGRTAVITGAGGGLGRSYALELARRGANVIVNDLSNDATNAVVKEIRNNGGNAINNNYNVVNSPQDIINHAIDEYGSIDILINNAGILRDKSFLKSNSSDWHNVVDVHLNGTYGLCKEAWIHMIKNEYGRIVNIGSGAGLYGNFGQASYSASKMAIIGLTQTLAQEGSKYNIKANVVVPIAESRMTETVLPKEILSMLEPEHVAPFVSYLCHDDCNVNGNIYEIGGGWYSQVRWQRSAGIKLGKKGYPTNAESIKSAIHSIQDFEQQPTYPTNAADALKNILAAEPVTPTAKTTNTIIPTDTNNENENENNSNNSNNTSDPCESDIIFSTLQDVLNDSKNKDELLKTVGTRAVQFVITYNNNKTKVWIIDFCNPEQPNISCFNSLNNATISRHDLKSVDVILTVSDENFLKLCSGDLSVEWAYATSKITVDGSMGVAMKLKNLLNSVDKYMKNK
jgi:(3R)-3-hydroxyacyl-CoA dehydrogenase / 3a,7a,12a-trihydroxy-5b-cholest-24-enoyl-CoA hydratase / enoyl-CoA hydratase 2